MTAGASGLVVVGLVGRIAAGKSTVARALAARGADVIDADALAHEVLDEPAVRTAVGRRFGAGVLRDDGRVDRAALATLVFGGDAAAAAGLRDLEALVHPRVRERVEAALAGLRAAPSREAGRRVAVLDVPLLMQSGWDGLCDRLLLVACDEEVRRRRLVERGWTATHRDRRDAAWERAYRPPPPWKTTVVDASGDVAYIQGQIDRWWRTLG